MHWQCGVCVVYVCVQCPFFVVHALSLSLCQCLSKYSWEGVVERTVITAGGLKEKPTGDREDMSGSSGQLARALLQCSPMARTIAEDQ